MSEQSQQQEQQTTDETWRAELEAAFDQAEAATQQEQDADDAGDQQTAEAQQAAAQQEKVDDTGAAETGGEKQENKDGDDTQAHQQSQEQQQQTEAKAPQSWGVAEREAWASLPPEIQAQIDKRERETAQVLTESAEARRFKDEWEQLLQPYQPFIAAERATPQQAVHTLMQTAASLQAGTPQAKAQRIADLVKGYNVDVHMLDAALSGSVAATPEQAQMQSMLQQHLAPINQFMQQQQQQQYDMHQQQQTAQQQTLDQFLNTHEFARDVQLDMADIMEMSANRGQEMTLEQAYERAIQFRPDIQQIIDQRKAAAAGQQSQEEIKKKEDAAASVAQGGAMQQTGNKAPSSRREALEAAFGKEE